MAWSPRASRTKCSHPWIKIQVATAQCLELKAAIQGCSLGSFRWHCHFSGPVRQSIRPQRIVLILKSKEFSIRVVDLVGMHYPFLLSDFSLLEKEYWSYASPIIAFCKQIHFPVSHRFTVERNLASGYIIQWSSSIPHLGHIQMRLWIWSLSWKEWRHCRPLGWSKDILYVRRT